ncbi:hypothetical protein AAC387_Pa02g0911 [Persea americana]
MKDLGPLHYFLGLEVHQSTKGIVLNQHKYTVDLIALAGLTASTPVDTPVELNVKLSREEGDLLSNPTAYRQLVGSLIYLTITRPDISYMVNLMSQFMTAPRYLHLAVVRRIIQYLIRTPTHRRQDGACFWVIVLFLGNARNMKKFPNPLPRPSTELCLLLHGPLSDIGFPAEEATPLYADNTSAIRITENPIFHECTKHIKVDCHFIHDELKRDVISLPHVSTELQIADILTKGLPRPRHQFLVGKLMLVDSPASI